MNSPVQLSASAKGDATIRAWKVYVDGTAVWSPDLYSTSINPQLPMSPGQHRITAKAWDVNGKSYSATIYVTVNATSGPCVASGTRTITVCSPHDGSTVQGPWVRLLAAVADTKSMTGGKVYVDGSVIEEVTAFYLNSYHSFPDDSEMLTPGTHRITFKVWDSAGSISKTVYVTVQ